MGESRNYKYFSLLLVYCIGLAITVYIWSILDNSNSGSLASALLILTGIFYLSVQIKLGFEKVFETIKKNDNK